MYEEMFPIRLTQLRTQEGISARDMSLSIGQNPGYINNIETGKALPSLTSFFYICEYLKITPSEFFDSEIENPRELHVLLENLKKLTPNQLSSISTIVEELVNISPGNSCI